MRDFNLSLRLSEVSSLHQRNWSVSDCARIPLHFTTVKIEKVGKKSGNVHKNFTFVITLNLTSVMILLIIRSFHTLTDFACRDIIK